MKKHEGGKSNLSRRDLLRAIGVGAAGTLVSTAARSAEDSAKTHKTEVVIVGAGFAGLTAARELVRKGRNVTASVVG
jgi:NADPH-dependent 2,4-dienoyl-CoA reductase/sulfur reductase-like enzyme